MYITMNKDQKENIAFDYTANENIKTGRIQSRTVADGWEILRIDGRTDGPTQRGVELRVCD